MQKCFMLLHLVGMLRKLPTTYSLVSGRSHPRKILCSTIITGTEAFTTTRTNGVRIDSIIDDTSPSNIGCSDRIIHVSNLDWFSTQETVAGMLRESVRQSTVPHTECEEDGYGGGGGGGGGGDTLSREVQITFKEMPPPSRRKRRDKGKFHAGSATLTFPTPEQARRGWENLLQHTTSATTTTNTAAINNTSNSNVNKSAWRLRWAPLYNSFEKRPSPPLPSQDVVTPARLALRKLRAARYARRRQRVATRTDCIIEAVHESVTNDRGDTNDQNNNSNNNVADALLRSSRETLQAPPFLSWETRCPAALDPMRGIGRGERAERKRAAVEAFWFVLHGAFLHSVPATTKDEPVRVQKRQIIADLGCGSGNLALPLAWWLSSLETCSTTSSYTIRAVDWNQESLQRLTERAQSIHLNTVETVHADIADLIATDDSNVDLIAECDAVVSLHACGSASDWTIASAVSHNLPFVISPCCIGKVKRPRGTDRTGEDEHGLSYPRSNWLRDILAKIDDKPCMDEQNIKTGGSNDAALDNYELLANAADYGVNNSEHDATVPTSFGQYVIQQNSPLTLEEVIRRQRCQDAKRIIEMDRLQYAVETGGYQVRLMELPRLGPHYAKRQLLLGAPAGSLAAERMMHLPTLILT